LLWLGAVTCFLLPACWAFTIGRVRTLWRRRRLRASLALVAGGVLLFFALPALAGWISGDRAVAPLLAGCEPLSVVDRDGRPLRVLPAACGHRGRGAWVPLHQVPPLLREAVLVAEDRRFFSHPGVDLRAVLRAARDGLRAGEIRSGASTLSMQLARMLHGIDTRSPLGKLEQAWLALALERRLDKEGVLEAYLNHAYFGRGAYGVSEAASRYCGRPLQALDPGELVLLAVLPRAPHAYDPLRAEPTVRARRSFVLALLERAGKLSSARRSAIEREPLRVLPRAPVAPAHAGHFVDWAIAQLPAAERRRGGELRTTLDLALQSELERAVAQHVAQLRGTGIDQAGLVVLDAQSGQLHALVGSADYARAQLDITTRRRKLGSVLKPFVFALALERGASPSSIALDVGDADSAYRARDWVGREGGVLAYREALAGSYNLAALHVLERAGVAALHARLRAAGVAELSAAPDRYGLPLALGNARVRLLDLAAGYGFLVREGRVREASGVNALWRRGGLAWQPPPAGERALFSPEVSWLTMDMLSDPAARHQRFGRDLPVERLGRVVAKTGTASGLADLSAVLATREWIVAAWAGRFDGKSTRGSSGMWGAGPLAASALEIALRGATPSLPRRPDTLVERESCALSGAAAGPSCPRTRGYVLPDAPAPVACPLHGIGGTVVPQELHAWAERGRVLNVRRRDP
jgi:penicillin-binding protein 1C